MTNILTIFRCTTLLTLSALPCACAPEVQNFHRSRINGFVASAELSAGEAAQINQRLQHENENLEGRIRSLRALVERAEHKADMCETKAQALSRKSGTYSKIR